MNYLQRYGLPLGTLLGMLALWAGLVYALDVAQYIFPSPLEVVSAFGANTSKLGQAFSVTLRSSVYGLGMAALVGASVAVLFVRFPWMEKAFMPYVILTQTTPVVAIAPLIVLWAGNGMLSRTIIAFLIAFFPIVVNTVKGFRAVDQSRLELMLTYNARPLQIFQLLRLPAALPDIFAALRIAATLAVIGSVVGELVTGNAGLGFIILQASYQLETPLLFAAVLCAAITGISLFLVMVVTERAIPQCRYR